MSRRKTDDLKLRGPLPTIPGVGALGIRVTYATNAPAGWTVALLRLPNDYYVAFCRNPREQWSVALHHYVVPGTRVVDPRPLRTDPFTGTSETYGIKWPWTDGYGTASALRALAALDPYIQKCEAA
ncbi:hypothetical protein ABZV92_19980 [Streptomyces rubiginosohelvolus]|uniref:hypothetical protein n=1 Tax=Streptomyces rubiginosohelvolus TaxID=67362 RepID=UPI0033A61C66